MSRVTLALALGAALVLSAARAHADAVPPRPSDCPPGTHAESSHYGRGCVSNDCPSGTYPAICDDAPCCLVADCPTQPDSRCAAPKSCKALTLCVRPTTQGGRKRREVQDALAVCARDRSCPEGSTCQSINVCLDPASAPSSAPSVATRVEHGGLVPLLDEPKSAAASAGPRDSRANGGREGPTTSKSCSCTLVAAGDGGAPRGRMASSFALACALGIARRFARRRSRG